MLRSYALAGASASARPAFPQGSNSRHVSSSVIGRRSARSLLPAPASFPNAWRFPGPSRSPSCALSVRRRAGLALASTSGDPAPGPRRGGSGTTGRIDNSDDFGSYAGRSYDYAPSRSSTGRGSPPPPPGGPGGRGGGGPGGSGGPSRFTTALIGGAFILGMGAGIFFDSEANFEPTNVASTSVLDEKTPSSEVCMANGYSSMVFDQRIFVSLNPFNVYVSQPEVKPGCVLRRANVNVLEQRKLVNPNEVDSCKKRMNTFAYVGDLQKSPEVSCVYHSEAAENQYLIDPKKAVMGDGYQPRAGQ